jgi:choice-of-anchor B domain-containing protein
MTYHRLAGAAALAFALSSVVLAHEGDPKLLWRQPAYQGPGFQNQLLARAVAQATSGGGGSTSQFQVALDFPRNNVTLLAWMPLSSFGVPSGGNGNSCFGYTSPSGREYAIFGHSVGTAFVEITNPGAPVIVANIAGPQSLWRDMRVYQSWCYAGSEGGSGIQVFDMSQIDAGTVTLANTITTGGDARTHTLELNTQSGFLYRAGGGANGLRIYDLRTTPQSPVYVGGWFDRYVHEAQVVTYPTGGPGGGPRELAICCGGLNGGFADVGIDIVDVTNKAAPVSLAHIAYPNAGFSHQAWLSPDRTRLYHNDETDNRPFTRVFDATGLNNPTPTLTYLGEFQNGTTVDHNIYTKGTLVFEANYRSGLRVFDTSSGALTPTLVANFDTYPDDDVTGYNGLWNNYPYFPSGTVIGSDIEKGLFVWWVGTPPVSFAYPAGRPTTVLPAGQRVAFTINQSTAGQLVPGSATIYIDTGAGYQSQPLVQAPNGQWHATFPATNCGTQVRWYLSAQSQNGVTWFYPEGAPNMVDAAVSSYGALTVVSDSFETASGWTAGVTGDTATAGQWTRVDPVGTAAQPEDDHSPLGTLCFVTGQGAIGGAVGAADVDGGVTTLLSPRFNLAANPNASVSYWRWYSNGAGAGPNADVFTVDISNNDGATWVNAETVGPAGAEVNGGWIFHQFRVADFVTPSATVRLRFRADDAGTGSVIEAAIDDVRIDDVACTGYAAFCFGDGSGTACPCGNAGATGRGCANSTGAGALLAAGGVARIAGDSFTLTASGMPSTVSALYFQGTNQAAAGAGTVFGDGLRCAAGTVIRLGTKTAAAGVTTYPGAGDASVSVRGAITAGATRTYQVWYRNAAAFCSAETFNLTNGVLATWSP